MDNPCNLCDKREALPQRKRCEICNNYFKARKARLKNEKKCQCGRILDVKGKKTCSVCLESKKVYYVEADVRKRRDDQSSQRLSSGLCVDCGLLAHTEEDMRCKECLLKIKTRSKIFRKAWVSSGLCNNCGASREDVSRKRCWKCTLSGWRATIRRKIEVLSSYGSICDCCGQNQIEMLSIDHIEGGGGKHRKNISSLYLWLKKNKYPTGFRILCFSCNGGRASNNRKNAGGVCPHKDKSQIHGSLLVSSYAQKRLNNELKIGSNTDFRLRISVIEAYGGKCVCCNTNQLEFLGMDHILGDGRKHLKEIGGDLYRWLRKNSFPKEFRVLCRNCNQGRFINGGNCPHIDKNVSHKLFTMTERSLKVLNFDPSTSSLRDAIMR